jgi:hypothetical protein
MKISLPRKDQGYKHLASSIPTAVDAVVHAHTTERVATDSPDDTPTDLVTPANQLQRPHYQVLRLPVHLIAVEK